MKFATFAAAVLPVASAARYSKEEYTSGAVMAKMMEVKEVYYAHNPHSMVPEADASRLVGPSKKQQDSTTTSGGTVST